MECPATDSADVEKVALPPLSVPVPSVVAPSLNVTVPVGVPEPGPVAVTVAVNVTDPPKFDGFVPDTTAVVVADCCPTCDVVDDVLVTKFVSPPYTAVIECVATDRLDV